MLLKGLLLFAMVPLAVLTTANGVCVRVCVCVCVCVSTVVLLIVFGYSIVFNLGTDTKTTANGNPSGLTGERSQERIELLGAKIKVIDGDQNNGEMHVKKTTLLETAHTLEESDEKGLKSDGKLVELTNSESNNDSKTDSDLPEHSTVEATDHDNKPTDAVQDTADGEMLVYANASKAKKRRIRRKRAEERIRLKEETRRARTEERLKQQAEEDARKQIVPYVGNSTGWMGNMNTSSKVCLRNQRTRKSIW